MSCPDDEAIPAVGAPVFSIKSVCYARVQKQKVRDTQHRTHPKKHLTFGKKQQIVYMRATLPSMLVTKAIT
jgi:hypothetical protein